MHRYKVGTLPADADYLSVPGRMTSPEPGYERGRLLFVWGRHRPITALIVLCAVLVSLSGKALLYLFKNICRGEVWT